MTSKQNTLFVEGRAVNIQERVEGSLNRALDGVCASSPPRLAAAVRYAVFPGGARIRPRISLAVSLACCGRITPAALAAATSIELLHCASLVHDDLPCFDDASTRRGRPALHRAFGVPLAVLAGDALIVLSFQVLARASSLSPRVLPILLLAVARGSGMPSGIVAGQAWECEDQVALDAYQRAKTGGLFAAAAAVGALCGGAKDGAWGEFGARLGEAYQIADDLRDAAGECEEIGKPVGRDEALGRPSAVRDFGLAGAVQRLDTLIDAAVDAIPECSGRVELCAQIRTEAARLLPRRLARPAA